MRPSFTCKAGEDMTSTITPYAQVPLPGAVVEKPVLVADNSVLIVIAGETLLAIDSVDPSGTIPWASNPVYPGLKGALVSDGVVYCVSGKKLLGFNVTDGACPWGTGQPDEANADLLPPVESGDFVYLLDVEGTHYRFSKEYGVEDSSWRGQTYSGTVSVAPVMAGNLLIYAVEKFLIALETGSDDGKQVWRFDFGSIPVWTFAEISAPLRAIDGELFVCLSSSHGIMALYRLSWKPGGIPVPVVVQLDTMSEQAMDLQWLAAPGFAPNVNWLGFAQKHFSSIGILTYSITRSLLAIVVRVDSPAWVGSALDLSKRYPGEAFFAALFEGAATVAAASVLVAAGTTVRVQVADVEGTVLNDYQTTIHVTAAPIVGPERQVYLCGHDDELGKPVLALFTDVSSSAEFHATATTYPDSASNPVAVGILQAPAGNAPAAARKAFVPTDKSLVVVDLSTQPPAFSKIPIDDIAGTSQGIAVSWKGHVLIAATGSQRVVVFDPAAGRVVKTFDDVPSPKGIALVEYWPTDSRWPSHSYALVTNWDQEKDTVTIIDFSGVSPDHWSLQETVKVGIQPAGTAPALLYTMQIGRVAFVANQRDGTISLIEHGSQWSLEKSVPAGSRPFDMAVSQGGQRIYVTNRWDESAGEPKDYSVWVFNGDSNWRTGQAFGKKIAQIALPAVPFGLAVVPNSRWLLVACEGNDTVQIIDTVTFAIVDSISLPAGSGPRGIAVTPEGDRAVVANYAGNSVTVIDIK